MFAKKVNWKHSSYKMKAWKADQSYICREEKLFFLLFVSFFSWYQNTGITSYLLIQVSPSAYLVRSTICLCVYNLKEFPSAFLILPKTSICVVRTAFKALCKSLHCFMTSSCSGFFFSLLNLFTSLCLGKTVPHPFSLLFLETIAKW